MHQHGYQLRVRAIGAVAVLVLASAATHAGENGVVTDVDRGFWAFRPPRMPAVPQVAGAHRVRTPIDAFLLARLKQRGLAFAGDADRYALVRRVTFDLIGLPPTPAEVDAFVADTRPDAYERLLDRLLASPHFGERWGRHWLDAAGYVDVLGGDNDLGTIKLGAGKWRYRDYVVRAFNQNKPFDRFLTEQLAGDELLDWRSTPRYSAEMQELLVATGFLRVASDDTDENELNTLDIRHGVLNRTVETVASNLLGMTLSCAKCHDHKFDPIPQEDYYRLTALFAPALNPDNWVQPKQRALGDLAPAEKAELTRQAEAARSELAALVKPHEAKVFADRLATVPAELRDDTQTAVRTPPEKRSEVQKYLAGKYEAHLKTRPEDALVYLAPADRQKAETALARLKELDDRLKREGSIQAVYDVGAPTVTHLLRRGDYLRRGQAVTPGYLRVLCRADADATATPVPVGKTSGRRLALARWLTAPDTSAAGLVARVQVNRVWQHLFGVGIVPTMDNLGPSGMRPTHPELIDWLAADFIRRGWQFKPFLKQIMLSTAYRQSSAVPQTATPNPQSVDPDNKLLGQMRLRRLEAESVRDALLAVGGKLDPALGGPPLPLTSRPDGLVVLNAKEAVSPGRRSLYVLARRNYHLSILGTFDQPVVATNCTCREPAAVVGQSLTMLNDAFVLEQAAFLAERVAGGSTAEQIQRAYRLALSRPPKAEEIALCGDFVAKQTARFRSAGVASEQASRDAMSHLCHMLLNTNEFLYVP
jgi:hypothetical protein